MKVRTIILLGDEQSLKNARIERERHMKWLREQKPERKAAKAIAIKEWRNKNKEYERERKKKWRQDNIERVRAYWRNYDLLTPGRREYKAKWLRAKRENPTRTAP